MDNNNTQNQNQKIAKPKVERRKVSISKIDDIVDLIEKKDKKQKEPKIKEPKTPRIKQNKTTVLIEKFPDNEIIDLINGYCPPTKNLTQPQSKPQAKPKPQPQSQSESQAQCEESTKSNRKPNSWILACQEFHNRTTDSKFVIPKRTSNDYQKILKIQDEMKRRCAF